MTFFLKPAPAIAAILLALAPSLAAAGPLDLLYERTVMTAADTRCRLFTPEIGAALAAGRAQARGAALRAGTPESQIAATERRATAAAGRAACRGKDLTVAAERVRSAFEAYAKVTRISYPGDLAGWDADRNITREARWRLSQTTRFGFSRMVFGLAGREAPGALMAVAEFSDARTPYAARLIMRDGTRTMGAYLDGRGGASRKALPLARRMPPASALKTYAAEARSPAGQDLLPKTMKAGWAFRFPAEAARRLAELDPREAVAVEFLFAGGGEETVRAYVEVGDFAAGRAFLQVASR